jgi:4-hydroxybenzoyl-CoA thioesterase
MSTLDPIRFERPRRIGLPTVHIDTDFRAPSALGDDVRLGLQCLKLGHRSFTLRFEVLGPDRAMRLASTQVLVSTDLNTHRAIPIPPDLRAAMQRFAPAG